MSWTRDENCRLVFTEELNDSEEKNLNRKEEIISLYLSGNYSVAELSIEFSCNRSWIYEILEKAKVRIPRKRNIDYKAVDKLIADGLSNSVIAKRLGCTAQSISKRRKELSL
jgi:DNA invertase Pin-like site-specific DNA recombinase